MKRLLLLLISMLVLVACGESTDGASSLGSGSSYYDNHYILTKQEVVTSKYVDDIGVDEYSEDDDMGRYLLFNENQLYMVGMNKSEEGLKRFRDIDKGEFEKVSEMTFKVTYEDGEIEFVFSEENGNYILNVTKPYSTEIYTMEISHYNFDFDELDEYLEVYE